MELVLSKNQGMIQSFKLTFLDMDEFEFYKKEQKGFFEKEYEELFGQKTLKRNYSPEKGYSQKSLTFWRRYLEYKIWEQVWYLKSLKTPQERIPTADMNDYSSAQSDKETLVGYISRGNDFLEKLYWAWLRITKHKNYAGCETQVGYRYIDPGRLFAAPHTTKFVEVKNANNSARRTQTRISA